MRYLLDTHTLIWTLYDPASLSVRVRGLVSGFEHELYGSHVSILEITDKASKGRLPLAGNSPDAILEDLQAFPVKLVPISLEDILASVKLPRHHNDPLDRLLIAQAQRLGATLLSKDGMFKLYDVPVLWS